MLLTFYNPLKILCCLALCSPLVAAMAGPAATPPPRSPAGLWNTVDDRTHQPRGTIRIEDRNGIFSGRIESSFNPAELKERCVKCEGDRKDAPVLGLLIMRGMRKHGSDYEGGDILDPDTGSVYRCRFTLSADGQKLSVRGFLGMSVFGRTQTWTRAPDDK